jgi:hypothetical protein
MAERSPKEWGRIGLVFAMLAVVNGVGFFSYRNIKESRSAQRRGGSGAERPAAERLLPAGRPSPPHADGSQPAAEPASGPAPRQPPAPSPAPSPFAEPAATAPSVQQARQRRNKRRNRRKSPRAGTPAPTSGSTTTDRDEDLSDADAPPKPLNVGAAQRGGLAKDAGSPAAKND